MKFIHALLLSLLAVLLGACHNHGDDDDNNHNPPSDPFVGAIVKLDTPLEDFLGENVIQYKGSGSLSICFANGEVVKSPVRYLANDPTRTKVWEGETSQGEDSVLFIPDPNGIPGWYTIVANPEGTELLFVLNIFVAGNYPDLDRYRYLRPDQVAEFLVIDPDTGITVNHHGDLKLYELQETSTGPLEWFCFGVGDVEALPGTLQNPNPQKIFNGWASVEPALFAGYVVAIGALDSDGDGRNDLFTPARLLVVMQQFDLGVELDQNGRSLDEYAVGTPVYLRGLESLGSAGAGWIPKNGVVEFIHYPSGHIEKVKLNAAGTGIWYPGDDPEFVPGKYIVKIVGEFQAPSGQSLPSNCPQGTFEGVYELPIEVR